MKASLASTYAAGLVLCCLDGVVPVVNAEVAVVAGACGCMVSWSAGALRASGRPQDVLEGAGVLTRNDQGLAELLPDSPPADRLPNPVATAQWLAEREAAGEHDLVDAVMTGFLSPDLAGSALVLAQLTGHLLRLVDGPGAHAMVRARAIDATR